MKKIYFVINDISMPGGLARVTLNLHNQFLKIYPEKYSVKIITGTISDNKFKSNEDIINLNLHSLHETTKLQKIIWYFSYIYHLKKFLKKNKSDIIIGIATMTNLCLTFLSSNKYKLYGTEHLSYESHGKIEIFLRKLLYRRLNKIISLTRIDEKKYKKFHNDVGTIPNFTTFFSNKKSSNLENKTILSIGRFTHQKGYDLLVNFIKPFFEVHSDWKLILIGEGPMKSTLLKYIKDEQLSNHVLIHSPSNNIVEYYLKSSIYIMSSRYEGFPMVLLEAKSIGLPIVSFDCPTGPSEIIHNNEDGFLIPMNDNQMFLEKLSLLANNFELREEMGKKAIENVKEFYPDKIMQQWEKILDE